MLSRQGSVTSSVFNAQIHPQQIGPWRLGKTLGRGATGRVLLGVHQTTGQKAAVKVVSKLDLNEDYEQPQDRKGGLPYGIEREIIIMKLLTHPNVLRLYDVWETSKALYLVLEYVEGGELFDLLVERGPLEEQEAVKYFRQIILGTAYCHALGICHRDLKPENLLLDSSLNVKLADFGMAALESNGKLLETSCGSPHYAAPEIVSGLKYHGAASDVWSCGVILFALLTGRLPFDDENIRNLLLKVQAGNFEMPLEISPEAQDLIWKMLTVDPMERLTTSDVLSHRLLAKYPCPNEDLISVKSLPHPKTAYKSLGSVKNIDRQILENLSILWNLRPEQEIILALLKEGPTPEKTFYALLLRYRHTQDDATLNPTTSASPTKNLPRSTSALSNRAPNTPRRGKMGQVSASSSRNRPVSFQRRYGARNSVPSPSRDTRWNQPSPARSPRKRMSFQPQGGPPPRDIYNEIMAVSGPNESYTSMPPTLPSKDTIHADAETPATAADIGIREENKGTLEALSAAPFLIPNQSSTTMTGAGNKRNSILKQSNSRMSRRKSIRQSLNTGMKRNSITIKLLSTYAKLSNETDWEYMDKQTKRTSATFGMLCDKIFNHEAYDEEDEKLIDEEEKKAKEYEKLMELERKKHEAELKARKELAKQQKRQKRRSLFSSSKKLHITVTEDGLGQEEAPAGASDVLPGKRNSQQQKQAKYNQALRALSEGVGGNDDELKKSDLDAIKKRSVTQPIPRRRQTPVLSRRPVSRLDPLWLAHENEKLTRAQDALKAEFQDMENKRKNRNRESMVSFGYKDDKHQYPKDSDYDNAFELPEHKNEDADLSEEYLSEIRKSRLLNSQLNLNAALEGNLNDSSVKRTSKIGRHKEEERKTLIGSVNIPKVTRKSSNFTNSNKRLSLLSLKSTKESYQDLNSFLDTHNEDLEDDELNEEEQLSKAMPGLRTSFADRLDHAGSTMNDLGDDDEPLDSNSVIDLDEHLANKRTSYYAGPGNNMGHRKSVASAKSAKDSQRRRSGVSQKEKEADYTFAEDDTRPKSNADEVFESIKLPESKKPLSQGARTNKPVRAAQPSPSTMLLPDLKAPEKPTAVSKGKKYGELAEKRETKPSVPAHGSVPLMDSTNLKPKTEDVPQKRNRSIFRKLSWGTKKLLDEEPKQLPSPANSSGSTVNEPKGGLFLRLFSSSDHSQLEVHTYKTILPKQEMMSALFSLLNSWTNFGLKDLRRDNHGNNILGSVSKRNSFNFKSCKFRIQIAQREMNQKSEVICVHTKGAAATSKLLFQEIKRVLEKEGVMDE
ncbi:Pkinase-domain-containing protein [Metschnikowia bicuspidata var. bicuspidata NRRL YB-4993]|uniref:non-specific serine/threonine protein kinase n=1 Tax=Metschnikowia bicuspidata var. bicuspidata NRRL YB-4993 TaxID=869754 RepID=A0A1A0HG23_9ASCO|nr:Pkinase-domain-containing protein [Metschnikowia bicuspidata var. bicuspidata NRRL YB-4993]OBA22951.1 Pkinase-domain-containing protein [Metschnikowia bicuspidata var. bicuspidata NRRL YB-4993]